MTEPAERTLLISVLGRDRPGVTRALFARLAPLGVSVADVEQVVVRRRLLLGVLVTTTLPTDAVAAALSGLADGVTVSVEEAPRRSTTAEDHRRHHVTLLGPALDAAAFGAFADRITASGGNIDRIVRLARYPTPCYELLVSGAQEQALRVEVAAEAAARGLDAAVQRSSLYRRAKRLVVLDVDNTLVQGEVIERLAARAGCEAEVARITDAAMAGEIDFEASLRARVATLAGLDASVLDDVRHELTLTPGARTLIRTLHRLGFGIALVSGGFTQVIAPLAVELGVEHVQANVLEVVEGRLTGRVTGPVVDRAGKARALERFAAAAGVPLSQTIAVGDGANDIDMLTSAGLGIAFNARPVVRAAADATVSVPYLDAILFLLGVSRDEIEAADADGDRPVAPLPEPSR